MRKRHVPLLTVSLIDDGWNMRTLSLDCSKAAGSAKGEDLAESVIAQVEKHKLEGRVTASTIDCEPSMVKTGRLWRSKALPSIMAAAITA